MNPISLSSQRQMSTAASTAAKLTFTTLMSQMAVDHAGPKGIHHRSSAPPILSQTMHEWNKLASDRFSAKYPSPRSPLDLRTFTRMQSILDLQARLLASGLPPTTASFNRLVRTILFAPDFDEVDTIEACMDTKPAGHAASWSRFKTVMGLLGAMEDAPLCLKPDLETFELALLSVHSRPRMMAMTEAVFQLMSTDPYGIKPSALAWGCRIGASLSPQSASAAHNLYAKFSRIHELDIPTARVLVRAGLKRSAFCFLEELLLPDLEARPWLALGSQFWAAALCMQGAACLRAVALVRWTLRTRALDASSGSFSEGLAWRWLEWLVASPLRLGVGAADIAEAAMRRIIQLRHVAGRPVPLRALQQYCDYIALEVSGEAGALLRECPDLVIPLPMSARLLAEQIEAALPPGSRGGPAPEALADCVGHT